MTLEVVDVERLARHPLQPRKDLGDLTELTESIREFGVLQPIVAVPDPTGTGRLFLLYGHRRRAAAVKAGVAEVPVVVRRDLTTDAHQLITMLAENLFREDISPVEESDAYEQLLLLDYTPSRIAQELGRRKDTVRRRLALRKLPPPVRDRLHTGQITIGDADVLVEFASDADVVGRLVDQIGTSEWRYTVEAERRRREQRAVIRKRIKAAAAAGVPVLRLATRDWLYDPPVDGTPAPLNRLDVDDHDEHETSCPGRVLVVYASDTQAMRACTEASRHGLFTDSTRGGPGVGSTGLPPPAGDEVADPRAAAERAEQEQALGEQLAAAADARDAWIREELLAAGARPDRAACTALLRQALLADLDSRTDLHGGRAAELLGLPFDPGDDRDAEAEAWGERLRAQIASAPLERLAQLMWAVLVRPGRFASSYSWRGEYTAADTARFLADVQALGYVPCDVERRMLAEHAAAGATDGADG